MDAIQVVFKRTMMKTFALRRTALIWNSGGIVVLLCGLGTINELFEAWTGAMHNKVACPMVILPNNFYSPFLDSIKQSAVIERDTILVSDFNLIQHSS